MGPHLYRLPHRSLDAYPEGEPEDNSTAQPATVVVPKEAEVLVSESTEADKAAATAAATATAAAATTAAAADAAATLAAEAAAAAAASAAAADALMQAHMKVSCYGIRQNATQLAAPRKRSMHAVLLSWRLWVHGQICTKLHLPAMAG